MNNDKDPISERIKQLFQFTSGYVKVQMIPRTEREKQIIRWRIFWIVFLFIIVSLSIFFFPLFYQNNIEVIFTAIITIVTTYFIVHQSKKVDYHKERLEHLPVFELIPHHNDDNIIKNGSIIEYNLGGEFKSIFEVINIGKGIAFNVDIYEIGEEDYSTYLGTLKVDGIKYINAICKCDEYNHTNLRFSYTDLFENSYYQDFRISFSSKDEVNYIDSEVPELIKRTRRFRYIQ